MHLELSKFWSRETPASIHVDTLTAMTGFTRFTEDAYPAWHFDKSEVFEAASFDLIVSSDSNAPQEFEKVSEVNAFTGFNWYPWDEIINDAKILKIRLPFHMNITPTIFIYRRKYPKEAAAGKYQQSHEIPPGKSTTILDEVTTNLSSNGERNEVFSKTIGVPENGQFLQDAVGHVSSTFEESFSVPAPINTKSEMPQQEHVSATAPIQQSSQLTASLPETLITEEITNGNDTVVSATSNVTASSVQSEQSTLSTVHTTNIINNHEQISNEHIRESSNIIYAQPESDDFDVEELDEESGESILDHEP